MTDDLVELVNDCQVAELVSAGEKLDPGLSDSCRIFGEHVRNRQAAVTHTYQLTAAAALRKEDAGEAAQAWKEMREFCHSALNALKELKNVYPECGTPESYDLMLGYMREADKRFYQNLEDSECARTPPPQGLFPETN